MMNHSRSESVELSHRLYRNMMEVTRQLDDLRSNAKATGDLFTVQAQVLKTKLKEIVERLLFSGSLVQRHKIDEILWRKGFYEDVSTAKRLRKNNQWLPEERSLLLLHLESGIGFYHHLLHCLQTEFNLSSRCIDFPMIFPDQNYGKLKSPSSSKQLEAACDSVHRCLICLGDLNRYFMDIPPYVGSEMAYRYYHQAISWNPDIGMPHNQLGTLSMSFNCNLDAVYHYMKCLMCSQPFEGAEGNLKRSFERNSLRLSKEKAVFSGSFMWRCHCAAAGDGQLSESQDYIQQFIAHFLLLADVWFFDKKPVVNISDLCHQTLLDFRQCLYLTEPPDPDGDCSYFSRPRENFPSYLSKDMVLKVVVVAMICLFNLRSKGSAQASSLVAFLLAIFCLLVQQVQEQFQESVLNLSIPTVKELSLNEEDIKVNGICDITGNKEGNNTNVEVEENGHHISDGLDITVNGVSKVASPSKKPKKKKVVRRRRNFSGDSDQSNDEECDALSLTSSEDENEDEEDEVVLDLSSDDDEEGKEVNDKINVEDEEDVIILEEVNELADNLRSNGLVNGLTDPKSQSKFNQAVNPMDILEQVTGDFLLPAIKVCTDWLQGDKSVIEACGKDSLDLFKKYVDLVNVINIDMEDPNANTLLQHRSLLKLESKVPLPEDIQLQKLPLLTKAHSNLDWELIRQNRLTSKEEALLRIQRLVAFCNLLQTIPETGVKYDENSRKYNVSPQTKLRGDGNVKSDQDLQRREEVMHSMGQLWLRAEVQNLETSIKKGNKGATFPPYLVLDVDALTKYHLMVGQLMASRKFIMVVPSVVLTALDQLKRESVLARDAIRWLEFQFQKGSRFLRAQTSHEALHLPLVSYPKQKCREAWSYFQILECCNYLNHQSSLSRPKESDAGFVTLVTGHSWSESNSFSPVGVAKAVGVTVDHIESFFAKWKTSSKSHG